MDPRTSYRIRIPSGLAPVYPVLSSDDGLNNFAAMLGRMNLIPLPRVPEELRYRFSYSQAFLLVCLFAIIIRNRD